MIDYDRPLRLESLPLEQICCRCGRSQSEEGRIFRGGECGRCAEEVRLQRIADLAERASKGQRLFGDPGPVNESLVTSKGPPWANQHGITSTEVRLQVVAMIRQHGFVTPRQVMREMGWATYGAFACCIRHHWFRCRTRGEWVLTEAGEEISRNLSQNLENSVDNASGDGKMIV